MSLIAGLITETVVLKQSSQSKTENHNIPNLGPVTGQQSQICWNELDLYTILCYFIDALFYAIL